MTDDFDTFLNAFARLDMRSRVLDGDQVLCPPSEDYGYQSTPRNALTFAVMGVDGVHSAILTIDGLVSEDSPVIQVSPMDSDDITVLAKSFLDYLADGCRVSIQQVQDLLNAERMGKQVLVAFLSEHFDGITLLDETRAAHLNAICGHLVERKI